MPERAQYTILNKVLKEEKPLGLSSGEFSWFLEVGEVLMVCKNLYGEGGS